MVGVLPAAGVPVRPLTWNCPIGWPRAAAAVLSAVAPPAVMAADDDDAAAGEQPGAILGRPAACWQQGWQPACLSCVYCLLWWGPLGRGAQSWVRSSKGINRYWLWYCRDDEAPGSCCCRLCLFSWDQQQQAGWLREGLLRDQSAPGTTMLLSGAC